MADPYAAAMDEVTGGIALPGPTPVNKPAAPLLNAPPPVETDPYAAAMTDALGAQAGQARANLIGAQGKSPDEVARSQSLGRALNVPSAVVQSNPKFFADQAQTQRNMDIAKQHSGLEGWVAADPNHAQVASDDFEQLGLIAKATKALTSGWALAELGNERGRLGARAMAGENVTMSLSDTEDKISDNPELEGVYGLLQKVSGFAGGLLDNFWHGGLAGGTAGGVAGAAAGSVAGGVGAVPGAAAGATLGAVVIGPAVDMGKVAAGNAYLEMSNLRGHDGKPLGEPVKDAAAVIIGLGTMALGTIGAGTVTKAAGEARAKLLSEAVMQAATKATVAKALTNFGTSLARAGIQGAALNAAMVGTDIFGVELAKQLGGGANFETVFNDPIARQRAVDQLITAATDGAMLFPLVHLPFAAGSLVGDSMRARNARLDTELFQGIETGAVDSKTRGRSLDAFRSFMASQTDGTPVENLSLTGEAVRTLYQSAGKEPGPGDGLLGDLVPDLRVQMQQADVTGGDIVVPTAAYVSRFAGTPLSESLRADIRFRPDGMTMREAEAYEAARGEHMAALAAEGQTAIAAEFQASEPARLVMEDVMHKLREAGQSAEAAQHYAAIVASRYEARAERYEGAKGTAHDLYLGEGLDIQREVPEALRYVARDEQDLVINALRDPNRKVPKSKELYGPSLHDAIREAGGIVDTGGELRAMDLDKTRGLIRKETGDAKADIEHSVDAMGLRMWERGYFPELIERPTKDQLFDAMRRGDERFSEGVGNERKAAFEEAVRDLDEFIGRSDLDLKTATNEQIKAAIQKHIDEQEAGGRLLNQDGVERVYRGEGPGTGTGNFYSVDREFARQFTRSGLDKEVKSADIKTSDIFEPSPHVYAGDDVAVDRAIEQAKAGGFKAVRLSEHRGSAPGGKEPASIFVFDKSALRRTMAQGERGQITLANGKSIITLFKDADLSTFLHESGHLWLDEMQRDAFDAVAPESLRADAKVIADWLGAKDFSDLTTEQHEQFARGFETYLMEGRAPSAALAGAFRKFKAWLVRIYKSVAALKSPISDDVRGVFDRMVATDTQIASWREAEALRPVFADAKSAGMTDAEFTAYSKGVEKARASAEEKLLDKTMKAIRRMRTAEWKSEAASVREDVAAQVRSRPDLKAQYFLRTGKMLDNPEAPAAETVRISKAALEDMYGTDTAAKALPNGIVAAKDGTHPDALADMFGYSSGDEMVRALMSLEASKRQAEEATGKSFDGNKYVNHLIESETTDRMLERHGDALNDGTIEAEALAAVHNKAQADVMAVETRAIARQAGKTAIKLKDIEVWASTQLADMPIKRASDQAAFARLEGKAGREAQRALLAGDMEAAFLAKQQQLVNHVMAREAGKVAEEHKTEITRMERLGKTATRDTIQQPFMDQIHALLERIGVPTKQSEPDAAATGSLREFVERMAGEGQDVFMPEFLLDPSWRADVRDMNTGEFFEVADAIKSLANLGRQMREMDVLGEKIRFSDITDAMRETIGDRTRGEIGYAQAVTAGEKAMVGVLTARAALRRMDSWALQMDRGNRNGPFTTYITRPVYAALDKYRPAKSEYLGKLWDILGPIRKELNQGKIGAPEIGYTFANKGELLHAIGHTGNDSNMRKLLLGRDWGEVDKHGELNDSRWRAMIQRLADQGTLKPADFDTVQKLWDLLEELKPGAQAAHKEIYGVRFGEVTARPTWTPFGERRGGYMPAVTDRMLARDGQIREDKAALNEQQTGAMFPSTGRGFTKARVENYAEPLELNLALIPSHIDSVLRFTHLQPTIRDVGRLMLKRSFKDMMRGVDPTVVSGMIVPWLQRTARQTAQIPATDPVGRMADKGFNALRRRSGLQILAFNLTNTLQQVVGVAPGILKSSPGAMMRSVFSYIKSPIETADRIAESSPFMDERMRSKSYDIILSLKSALEDTTPFDKVRHWGDKNGHILQQMSQNVVDITTWQAAYENNTGKGMSHADAVYAADAAVRETQGGFNPEDLSRFETGSALGRLFSHMYSYFGSQANLIGTESALVKELGFKKGAARAAMIYTFGIMIPSIVGEAIYRTASGGWDDDDGDDGMMGALGDFFVGAQAKYLAPMVPIAGPVAMAVIDRQQGDRIGTNPSVSVVKQATRAPAEIKAALAGDKAPGAAVRDSMTALGLATGYPLGQAGRPLAYLADVMTGWQSPDSAGDVARGLVTGKQKRNE
jgi:hypothetical protein